MLRKFGLKVIKTAMSAAHQLMLNAWTDFGFTTIIFWDICSACALIFRPERLYHLNFLSSDKWIVFFVPSFRGENSEDRGTNVWAEVAFQQGGQRRIFRIEVHWLDVTWHRDPRPLVYFHLNGHRPVWLGFMRCIFPLCARTEAWNGMNICYQLWFSVPKTNCSPPYNNYCWS
jgi:hypothetical protein